MILFLFKSQLLRKLFYIINTVGFIFFLITCNCFYIHNQIAVDSVNEKANLHIDLDFNKYLLGSIVFLLSGLILINISKNIVDKS